MCQYFFFFEQLVKKVQRLSLIGTGNYNYVQAGSGPGSIVRIPDPRFSIEIFSDPEHSFFQRYRYN
jgi:hypothetical protein